ncbi:MAG: LysR family transcriptional regulator [Burkholderiaceae bacterium]|nr:LysR family transcriptional regulator [Burkholderiaceae bacterium]
MDIKQLRAFLAIYELGGISRAAERERTAPSVLSHHLANLEAQFPKPLFIRNSRGLLPTESGHRLYTHAVAILRALRFAKEDICNMEGQITGQVAIGMAYSAMQAIGENLMRIVLAQYPGLSLVLSETLSGSTIEQLMDAQIDLALAYSPSQDARLNLMPLLEERMVCIGKTSVIGNTTEPITVEELLSLPYILLRKGITGRTVMNDLRLQKQFEQNARLETDNVHALSLFVGGGLGCVIGTQSYMREQTDVDGLAYRDIVEPQMLRTLYLCEKADKPPSSAVEVLRREVLGLIATEVREGRWKCERVMFDLDAYGTPTP